MQENFKTINEYFDFLKDQLKLYNSIIVNSTLTFEQRTTIEGLIKGIIQFTDGSKLSIMEFIFIDDENLIIPTYRFHWQSITDTLIKRWDNAPHHKNLKSFPHHLHDGNSVKDSESMSISRVLEKIFEELKNIH